MLLKQKPANIRKWIARFYYFRHFIFPAGSACAVALPVLRDFIGMDDSICTAH